MYRTYHLTKAEEGKITRLRFDGDTYYYDVFDSEAEYKQEEERLAKIDAEYEKQKQQYLATLR